MDLKKAIHAGKINVSDLSGVIGVAANLGKVLVKSGNKEEVFSNVKAMAHDTTDIFTNLGKVIQDKNIDGVIGKAQALSKILDKDSLLGDSVKDAYTVISALVTNIIKVIGDISTMNFGSLVQDGAALLSSAYDAFKMLKVGFKKFVDFYHDKIKPKMHEIGVKLHDAKEAVKKLIHHKKDADDKLSPEEKASKAEAFKEFWHKNGEKLGDKLDKVFHRTKEVADDIHKVAEATKGGAHSLNAEEMVDVLHSEFSFAADGTIL